MEVFRMVIRHENRPCNWSVACRCVVHSEPLLVPVVFAMDVMCAQLKPFFECCCSCKAWLYSLRSSSLPLILPHWITSSQIQIIPLPLPLAFVVMCRDWRGCVHNQWNIHLQIAFQCLYWDQCLFRYAVSTTPSDNTQTAASIALGDHRQWA